MDLLGILFQLLLLMAAALPVGLVGAIVASRGPELFAGAFRPAGRIPRARGIQEEDAFHLRLDAAPPAPIRGSISAGRSTRSRPGEGSGEA